MVRARAPDGQRRSRAPLSFRRVSGTRPPPRLIRSPEEEAAAAGPAGCELCVWTLRSLNKSNTCPSTLTDRCGPRALLDPPVNLTRIALCLAIGIHMRSNVRRHKHELWASGQHEGIKLIYTRKISLKIKPNSFTSATTFMVLVEQMYTLHPY